jgi:cysteinyl-tRNA synthetase
MRGAAGAATGVPRGFAAEAPQVLVGMVAGQMAVARSGAGGVAKHASRRLPHRRSRPRKNSGVIFALKLVASTLAGAAVTSAFWQYGERPVVDVQRDRYAAAAPSPHETVVYRRNPPARPSPAGRPVGRAESSTGPREVPSMKTANVEVPSQVASLRPPGADLAAASPAAATRAISGWRYQLQNIDPEQIAGSPEDLAVIDYDGDGKALALTQIERMRKKPDGSRRLVLAYLSIGEAESYRDYWRSTWRKRPPAWLGKANSRWRGNFAVHFWDPAWQSIVFERIDRLIAAGFDGVYLDKVDEFETLGHRNEMVEFVARIAERTKSRRPDALIVSQNGDGLIPDPKFRRSIDGFAREDLFYGEGSDGSRNRASEVRENIDRLKILTAEGKPVLVVEYPSNDEQAQTARRKIAEQGFIGLMARRSLSEL